MSSINLFLKLETTLFSGSFHQCDFKFRNCFGFGWSF